MKNSNIAYATRQFRVRRRNTYRNFGSYSKFPCKEIFACGFLFFALFCQLVVRVAIVRTNYDIEKNRQIALSKDLELRQLDLEYSSVSRPSYIRKKAGENLQMLPAGKGILRHVSL